MGCPTGPGCLGLTAGALALFISLFFGVGRAVSPLRCQEVEVSIEGLSVLPRPGGSLNLGGGCSTPLLAPLLAWRGGPRRVCVCRGSLAGLLSPSSVVARLAQCHLSHHLRSSRLSPPLQDDYIKSWEDNQPGDEGTPGMGLGWGVGGSVPAWRGGGTPSARTPPGFSLPAGSGGRAGACREAAAGAEAAAQLQP